MKTACIVRLGAFGDMVMISMLPRLLSEEGYHVTVNCHQKSASVLKHDPYISEFLIHDETIPNLKLMDHWNILKGKFDRFINLSESIEKGLLPAEGKDETYNLPHEERHRRFNVNYYDRTLELAGFSQKGLNGELHFSKDEEAWGKKLRAQYKDRFWVLWSLSGSSFHKTYPFADQVARAFLDNHRDTLTMTVGDDVCRLLEWDHPQNRKRCGMWTGNIRQALIVCKYADLVVSTETGLANAAGCFETPKIIMLSHSSVENLTKYWKNCVNLTPQDTPCYPCHQLHYTLRSCPLDMIAKVPDHLKTEENKIGGDVEAPICTTRLKPETLLQQLEAQYQSWRENKNGSYYRNRSAVVSPAA